MNTTASTLRHHLSCGLFVLACAAALACGGPYVRVDGFEVREDVYVEMREDVLRRARFDLECDALETTILEEWGAAPRQLGVAGCDRRAVYVLTPNGWVLNAEGARAR